MTCQLLLRFSVDGGTREDALAAAKDEGVRLAEKLFWKPDYQLVEAKRTGGVNRRTGNTEWRFEVWGTYDSAAFQASKKSRVQSAKDKILAELKG